MSRSEGFLVEQENWELKLPNHPRTVSLILLLKRELPLSSAGILSSVSDKPMLFSLLLMELERFNIS